MKSPTARMLSPGCFLAMMVVFAGVGKACQAPGIPQCFRNNSGEHQYRCEWGRSPSARNGTYDLLINTTAPPFENAQTWTGLRTNWITVNDDCLIKKRPVYIVVTVHTGNASCSSTSRAVVLNTIVKFPAPQNMAASWTDHKLNLTWRGQGQSASADVRVQSLENATQTWRHETNVETTANSMYWLLVKDLKRHMAYQVHVRQRATNFNHSLWSEWSSTLTVPAEIEQTPEVELKSNTAFENGTRLLVFSWKAVPPAARAGGVKYTMTYPHHCCPRRGKKKSCGQTTVSSTHHSFFVTHSSVNFSIRATNAVGSSSPRYVMVPAEPAKDLNVCAKDRIHSKIPQNSFVELYEFEEDDTQPHKTFRSRHRILAEMKDYVCYVYHGYQCVDRIPRLLDMCLSYSKEGVPVDKPLGFMSLNETASSVALSWLPIPPAGRRGVITHSILCHTKEHGTEECRNLTGPQTQFRLENLEPESRYNISLAMVTSKGSGPKAFLTVNTFPSDHPARDTHRVWISLGLLVIFFVASIMCSILVKRLKSKILPPLPVPVILYTPSNQAANQELEQSEKADEVSVHQPVLEVKRHWFVDQEENMEGANTIIGADEHQTQIETRDSLSSHDHLEEILYRNGLVFDMKVEELKSTS